MSLGFIIFFVILILVISLIPMGYLCSCIILKHQNQEFCDENPGNYNLNYKCFSVEGANNAKLSCWFIPAENSRGILIASHGISDTKNSVFPQLIPFIKAGYSLVIYDLRHHNESTGEHCTLGYWETYDLVCVSEYVEKYLSKNLPICFWGFSLGATVSILAATKLKNITAVVAQSPFVSLKNVVYLYALKFYNFPPWPVVEIALLFVKKRTGSVIKEVDVRLYRKELHRKPILLIGSAKDRQVPFKWLETIQYCLGSSVDLFVGPYGHDDNLKEAKKRKDIEFAIRFMDGAINKKIQMEDDPSEN